MLMLLVYTIMTRQNIHSIINIFIKKRKHKVYMCIVVEDTITKKAKFTM